MFGNWFVNLVSRSDSLKVRQLPKASIIYNYSVLTQVLLAYIYVVET